MCKLKPIALLDKAGTVKADNEINQNQEGENSFIPNASTLQTKQKKKKAN